MYADFPWWSPISENDKATIRKQLGKEPRGLLAVARRCRFGAPQVIVTSPVVWGPGRRSERRSGVQPGHPRVFPTLYWLSCPHLVVAVSRLEGQGMVGDLKAWVEEKSLAEAMAKAHARAARERLAVVDKENAAKLRQEHSAQWQVLQDAGIGGIRSSEGVKCLHLHLADYLAGPVGPEKAETELAEKDVLGDVLGQRNPVGARVFSALLQAGVDVRSGSNCEGCTSRCQLKQVATADVGTNSCRLLVTGWENQTGSREAYRIKTTRLGEGLRSSGVLAEEAQKRTVAGLSELLAAEKQLVARDLAGSATNRALVVVGTQALREATNTCDFLVRAWEQVGVAIVVIDGGREAELSFRGAISGLISAGTLPEAVRQVAVTDIGGGSTEFAIGKVNARLEWVSSVGIGAVRLKEQGEEEQVTSVEGLTLLAKDKIRAELKSGVPPADLVVGVGGTWTTLAAVDLRLSAYDADRVTGHVLQHGRIREIAARLAGMTLEERRNVPGLQPERADIIVPGMALALAALDELGTDAVVTCDNDLLLGLAADLAAEYEGRH